MQPSIIGKIIDNYEITGILGKGGMGVVYKAKDMTLDRDVAIKMMDTHFAHDEEFLKRFKSEAKALARLHNPNIVAVFALRETELGFALVMECVDGNTLADRIRAQGALSVSVILPIFEQLLVALDDAHRNNVIHRDIKPSNVMLTLDGRVKVTDFGLAKIQHVSSATVTVGTGGTLYYMSPEQIRGLVNVDARGDIYSIGMTLYEAATGRVPFGNNASDFDIRKMIVDGKIVSPVSFKPALPSPLVDVIMKSIQRDPAKRYQSCKEMLVKISAIETDEAAGEERAPPSVSPKYKRHPSPRRPLYRTVALGIALIGGYFGFRQLFAPSSVMFALESDPTGTEVFLGGASLGFTPLKHHVNGDGKILLRLVHQGYVPKDTSLNLDASSGRTFSVALAKLPPQKNLTDNHPAAISSPVAEPRTTRALLSVGDKNSVTTFMLRSFPAGTVSIDGGTKSDLGEDWSTFTLGSGEHSIAFENAKYGSKKIKVKGNPGDVQRLAWYFESYVSISTSGDASWGLVVIDGKTTDVQTPIDALPLGPGSHRITARKLGFETVEGEKIVVSEPSFERKVNRLSFTLKKK